MHNAKSVILKKELLNKTILLVIGLMILALLYYFTDSKTVRGKITEKIKLSTESSTQEDIILNCARKFTTDKQLIATNTKSDDCLFMGCGDFFQ